MNYEEALAGIHSRRTFSGGGPSLDRIRRLTDALGRPQEQFQAVHIAGTNGKGSVSAMTDAALRACGHKTGLFTSPYLVTAIGFLAFARAEVEYAVLEVGLGGRTDPTNVIPAPRVCCITSVSLDHTAILGNTVEAIAGEKAGIIKEDCPVVIARQKPEAYRVITERAQLLHAPMYPAPGVKAISQTREGTRFRCGRTELKIPLLGDYQMENAAAAWQVCRVLGLDADTVKHAFAKVYWPGRLQYIPGTPDYLVDAGHNPAGVAALCQTVDTLFADRRVTAVVSMMKDKDHGSCIPEIAARAEHLIGCSVGLPRSLAPEEIAREASDHCRSDAAANMAQALKLAEADQGNLILVCGSVFGAGAALAVLDSGTQKE